MDALSDDEANYWRQRREEGRLAQREAKRKESEARERNKTWSKACVRAEAVARSSYTIGARAAMDAFNGNATALNRINQDAADSEDLYCMAVARNAQRAAVYQLAELFEMTHAARLAIFSPLPTTRAELQYRHLTDPESFLTIDVPNSINTLISLRKALPYIGASIGPKTDEGKAASKPDQEKTAAVPTLPQEIRIVGMPEQTMRVLSMPDRRSETTFERDPESLEIVKSQQIERNAF